MSGTCRNQKNDELNTVSRYIGEFSRENKSDISQLTKDIEEKLASSNQEMTAPEKVDSNHVASRT